MSGSPIEQLLAAIDRLDVEAVAGLFAADARLLTVDGRRAVGREAAGELLADFLSVVRATHHQVTAHWHVDDVWIAEVDAKYELTDLTQTGPLPRVFVLRQGPELIADLRVYGAHERPLGEHQPWEVLRIGDRIIPPL